jgi:formate transporter
MSYKAPPEITAAAVDVGESKARLTPARAFVGAFLAGAYIAFGGLVAIAVSSGLDPKTWGTLPTLFTGATFALGLILVIIAGSELLTGNMALVPLAFFSRRIRIGRVGLNLAIVTVGNLAGALLIAYFLTIKAGVVGSHGANPSSPAGMTFARLSTIATGKGITETDWQIFLRAVGCNWLVCLAVWLGLAANDVAGKILGIFFPILAFVAIGFDHVVANMYFLPAAIFAHVPGITWATTWHNLWLAFLGNLLGAAFFVAGLYWFLYVRGSAPDRRRSGYANDPAAMNSQASTDVPG